MKNPMIAHTTNFYLSYETKFFANGRLQSKFLIQRGTHTVRFHCNVRYSQHITPYYMKGHILPLKFRIDYKICLTVFNCLNDIAPQYLQMLLSWNAPLSAMNCSINVNPRKTKDPYLLVIPSDFGKKNRNHSRCFS